MTTYFPPVRKGRLRRALQFAGWFLIANAVHAASQLSLPFVSPIFGDHLVLQRGRTNAIWGWTTPGATVRVEIAGETSTATAAADGRWEAEVWPPATGGPYTLTITGPQSLELHDLLVGDVWLCGGQSNMELPVSRSAGGEEQIRAGDRPTLRLFAVKTKTAYTPEPIPQGNWKVCSPTTLTQDGGFSAVGYYFALKIQSATNVPIGLIQDCLGGTPAESWTSLEALGTYQQFDPAMAEIRRLRAAGGPVYGNYVMPWYDEYDVGIKGNDWNDPALDDSNWKTVSIPGGFKELGVPDAPSVCYFRKKFVLPNPLPSGKSTLCLGIIEKMDTATINGTWVGASAWVENPRRYDVPPNLLHSGTNVITVRVFKTKPVGGFLSKPEELKIILGDKSEIPLAGSWQGRLSVDAASPHPLPLGFENWPVMPGVLYNGMIAPVAPLALAGALWYQGEANANRAWQYRTLLPLMMADWRRAFRQPNLPFYIVSLAAFTPHNDQPGTDSWAELREAQALTAQHDAHSGLAVTIDIGDADNIHPKDKLDAGNRLALCALANYYGAPVVSSGPTYSSLEEIPGALKLRFNHIEGGLVNKGAKLGEFSVAGADQKWHWADAKIESDTIIVSSPEVPEPKAARYAWQSNPVATLYNGAGLPAVPFRTDDWPLSTENARPY